MPLRLKRLSRNCVRLQRNPEIQHIEKIENQVSSLFRKHRQKIRASHFKFEFSNLKSLCVKGLNSQPVKQLSRNLLFRQIAAPSI